MKYRISVFLIAAMCVLTGVDGCSKEEFGGLGIEVPSGEGIVTDENPYKIVSVYEGGSAHRAGIEKDDIITGIDGKSISGMQYGYIVENLLRGKVGTFVILEVKRGNSTMLYTIQRGRVVLTDK